MGVTRVEITRRMRMRAERVGQERQDFHDKCQTKNAYGLQGDHDHWLKISIQGAMAELVVATHLGVADQWVECVEDYQSLKGDVIDHLQVRSTYNPSNGLILHERDKDEDCFVLVLLDRSHKYASLQGWLWANEGKLEKWWPGKHPDRPCFTVPTMDLRPMPLPVWREQVIRPKTNEDRVQRKRAKTKCAQRKVGGEFRFVCPKCGWGAKHLVIPYYDSPWRLFGGLCSECCYEAGKHFDNIGWPEPLVEEGFEELSGVALERLVKQIFGLLPPDKAKKSDRDEVDPNQTAMDFGQGAAPEE